MAAAAASADTVARRARVRGRVQGVWFRGSVATRARELGVSGYARNLRDGTVEVVAVGSAAAVDSLMAWLWQGPPLAEVSSVQVEDAADQCTVRGFTIG